jgi:hypothetical protein
MVGGRHGGKASWGEGVVVGDARCGASAAASVPEVG